MQVRFSRASSLCQLEQQTVMPACHAVAGYKCMIGAEMVMWVSAGGVLAVSAQPSRVGSLREDKHSVCSIFVCPLCAYDFCSESGRIFS